ncbi:helicase [Pseudenhygromyxa sp. WMMC2535]|nr:helicase [Pseudenhygromyxa sp. WMMC2535]
MGITAALGPTNTGKTHRAVERMLEHRSGIIGLPLRLLAREIYDRVSARVGESRVALVTGEEKRVPAHPDYWVCTVESMPMDREVDFLAVDEIQLAGHAQRGHVFCDRLLHARGRLETWFMGADTIRPVLEALVPTADVHRHPRLSQLRSAGSLSLGALPPRTAIVAFSTAEVYELAERLRRRRGGAAVVLGALSPRTRNAQVALYQAGEVDYMVATDAIGMGLNMDVDMVCFASLRKFDGVETRELEIAELAQIAGRAGRAQNDGQFCTLAPLPELSPKVVEAIELGRFPPQRRVIWRNSELDFDSVDALLESLRRKPPRRVLELVRRAEDFEALIQLAALDEIRALARGRRAVALLWEVCQIPDFRKLLFDGHVSLLAEIYKQLAGPRGRIDPGWMAERIDRVDDTEGDIHALMTRIAFVRTWTYVSNHRRWIIDAERWQARTRALEDRLSDALHERLVARFVEREARSAASVGHRRGRSSKRAEGGARSRRSSIDRAAVADGPFAKLLELRPDEAALRVEAQRDVEGWIEGLIAAEHARFGLDDRGQILDREEDDCPIARLTRGAELLRPEVALLVAEDLGAGARARLQRRLIAWSRDFVHQLLGPLRGPAVDRLSSDARGLVYQLERGLGTIHREAARDQLRQLRGRDRGLLESMGVRVGAKMIWVPKLSRPAALRERALLCSAALPPGVRVEIPRPGAVSLAVDPEVDPGAYTAVGFPVFGERGIRADILERAAAELSQLADAGEGRFVAPPRLASLTGLRADQLPGLLEALGYVRVEEGGRADDGDPRATLEWTRDPQCRASSPRTKRRRRR